jgi:hypothetical protein
MASKSPLQRVAAAFSNTRPQCAISRSLLPRLGFSMTESGVALRWGCDGLEWQTYFRADDLPGDEVILATHDMAFVLKDSFRVDAQVWSSRPKDPRDDDLLSSSSSHPPRAGQQTSDRGGNMLIELPRPPSSPLKGDLSRPNWWFPPAAHQHHDFP